MQNLKTKASSHLIAYAGSHLRVEEANHRLNALYSSVDDI